MLRFAAALMAGTLLAGPAPADPPRDVDLVLCLDTSNSMDGLIASAKVKLWDVVNELARVKPTPNLRVGLYSYGNTTYPAATGWVRKDLDLTTDLDAVYAKLNALTTNGGDEYVARVTRAAVEGQAWSKQPTALRVIFVCGNEPADQDKTVSLPLAAELAQGAQVIVNTIYCGPANDRVAPGWAAFAKACGGRHVAIDQNKATARPEIATPFDKAILEQNTKLNGTYVAVNTAAGREAAKNQVTQDANAANNGGALVGRAASKAGALYKNAHWDLVDKMNDDPKFDLKAVKDEELPEEMRKLKPEERLDYLKKKAAERKAIQSEIAELSAKRAKHIDGELKKQPKSDGEKALDEALRATIREQAAAKGFAVPDGK